MGAGDKELNGSGRELLLQFPCRFPIKVIGVARSDLKQIVFDVIKRHAGEVEFEDIQVRSSSKGNYQSLSVTITAADQEQLDAIYLSLNRHTAILMTL